MHLVMHPTPGRAWLRSPRKTASQRGYASPSSVLSCVCFFDVLENGEGLSFNDRSVSGLKNLLVLRVILQLLFQLFVYSFTVICACGGFHDVGDASDGFSVSDTFLSSMIIPPRR